MPTPLSEPLECGALVGSKLTTHALAQIPKRKRPEGIAMEPDDFVPHGFHHALDLVLPSLVNGNSHHGMALGNPSGRHGTTRLVATVQKLDLGRRGGTVLKRDAMR